ncbi:formate dehydrogenase [Massilia sp. KIM]|uniref:formate dehydrogenase n=1 Tax=Massilia sp. KIM TaxID=1955422 RepID=UPI0009D12DF2|nr:formate dehydrogenase [Massilia sp. KIM]OON62433.1 formate dehydrogenase [Massilia sp. KIM]
MTEHPEAQGSLAPVEAQAQAQAGQPAGVDPKRRHFLKAAPLGALAAVTANAAAAEAPAPAAPAAPGVKRGYHETEHIRRYYQTAAYW